MMDVLITSRKMNSMDLNIAPAEDSPEHILNALNDFCIQTIFRNLTNITDFVNAAEVCTRFIDNAKACFHLMFKSISMRDSSSDYPCRIIHFLRQKRLLQNFGHLIHEIQYGMCYGTDNSQLDCNLFPSIMEFCGKTLIKLKVYRYICNSSEIGSSHAVISFDSPNQFSALKELHVDNISVGNMFLCPNLQKLSLYGVKSKHFDDCIRTYPEMLKFSFKSDTSLAVMESNLLKFLEFNSQIIHLSIPTLFVSLKEIHSRTPNIVRFDCYCFEGDLNTTQTFPRLKHFFVDEGMVDKKLLLLATNMPRLESVLIQSCNELTAEGIRTAVELANNLEELQLDDMELESDGYFSILRTIRRRDKPCVVNVNCIYDVPVDVLNANLEILEFDEYVVTDSD